MPEASAQRVAARVAALAQQPLKQPLKQLPSLNRLEEFLFGQPAPPNKLPLDADLLNRLRYNLINVHTSRLLSDHFSGAGLESNVCAAVRSSGRTVCSSMQGVA